MTQAAQNTPAFDRFYVDDIYCALHRAAPAKRRGVCVVISPPMGRDARWVYRSMVIFGAALAAHGFDVVRYDPVGEGDSDDIALDADQWAPWTDDLVKVTAKARELTGAASCVLMGLRIGGTLARAAATAAGAAGLVVLDPLATGAAWIQELTFLRAMFKEPAPPESAVEALGLRISHATKASLDGVNLAALPPLAIPCLYASPIKNNGVIAALGPKADVIPFKGYASFFKEGHVNEYPEWTLGQVEDWLTTHFKPAAPLAPTSEPTQKRLTGDGFVEEPIWFGDNHCGVLTTPAGGPARAAVLIGNTGADPRAGTGNFSAFMARNMARRGVATLRIDFDGMGESEPRFGLRSSVYEDSRTDTYRQGAQFLAQRGLPKPDLIGVCTGGYHAVHALLDEPAFGRAMAINAWLLYKPGTMLVERESFLRSLRSKFIDAQPELAAKVDPLLDTARALMPSGPAKPPPSAVAAAAAAENTGPTLEEIHPIARATLDRMTAALRGGRSICLLMGHRDPSRGGLVHFSEEGLSQMSNAGLVQEFEDIDHGLFSLESQKIALGQIAKFLAPQTARAQAAAEV